MYLHKILNNLKTNKMKRTAVILVIGMALSTMLFQSCKDTSVDKIEVKFSEEMAENTMDTIKENGDPQKATIQNMKDAFKGETTAHAKYAAFSKKAEEEGYPEIAMLFKAASGAELIHANNHKVVLQRMGEAIPSVTPEFTVGSTIENLKNAIEGESYEFNTMYPNFIKDAHAAGNYMAQISLTYAYKVEQKHRDFYINAFKALEDGKVSSLPSVYYLCPTCGNTYATTAPARCEISMTDSKLFIKVDSL
ncbi:rubrerythrin family protein [Autumnicola edwardsiae]|uniref:Rubrerythrin family protein n=2 Tax=Flavobacteriaceae TaxID=49546 RepID=A0ABU3CTL4_9FLAO|nr:rubrerythrin family protein [Zunongwangia sp. F297]MDT0649255.1 rubrerythrin family protein [Zunongwangia sp. F297]